MRRRDACAVGHTIIRAGTLKGGAVGDSLTGDGGGESSFLNPFFYTLGQQDVVNWRLLYDCDVLGVDLVRRGPFGTNDMAPTALTDAACTFGTGAGRHDEWAGRDGCHDSHQLEGRRW